MRTCTQRYVSGDVVPEDTLEIRLTRLFYKNTGYTAWHSAKKNYMKVYYVLRSRNVFFVRGNDKNRPSTFQKNSACNRPPCIYLLLEEMLTMRSTI